MAGYKYFTVLTDVGKQKLVEAIANETALDFTEMAVGDSNGTSYDPTPDMTALKHETYRATISSLSIDEVDRNIMIFQLVVPSSSGGYYIREAGLFSSDGSLIAIARTAEQYKPQLSEGAGANIDINMRIAISSEAQIYINVPESDSYATQNYVKEEFKKHKADSNPHEQYVLNETYSAKIDELEEDINSKAASNHNHDSTYLKKTDASSTYATKSELSDGLAGKAANNHNHDSLYSKTNHTHTGYAASSHSHAFSAITGSMAITDSRLTGNLPVARVTGAAGKSKHYTTSAGDWIETPLSDGKILLEGWGIVVFNSSSVTKTINLPKSVIESNSSINMLSDAQVANAFLFPKAVLSGNSTIFMILYNVGTESMSSSCSVSWQFQGILA